MYRGELTGSDAIDIVIRELDFQSKTKGDGFLYEFDNRIASKHLTKDEQLNILRTLEDKGLIELQAEGASRGAVEGLGEENEHWVDLYIIKSVKVAIPGNATDNRLNDNSHSVRLGFRDGSLTLSIDGGEYKTIAIMTDDKKPFLVLDAVFKNSIGFRVPSADILGSKENLKQILTKSKYDYLMPFFEQEAFPYKIARVEELKMTKNELKNLLSKLNEKYRKNFTSYL